MAGECVYIKIHLLVSGDVLNMFCVLWLHLKVSGEIAGGDVRRSVLATVQDMPVCSGRRAIRAC